MNSVGLFILVLLYLVLLFFIASVAEKSRKPFWVNNPYIYSLSIAVYCSAWTYYGSIGVAATRGLEYLTIYIGPIIIIPAWILINAKIIRISRVNKISSIADFISLRYGNSRSLGALITLICAAAIVPYIGLQIKAISDTFHLVSHTANSNNIFTDSATYVVALITVFSSYYGTKYVDASEKRVGVIAAVAAESILKLIFFLVLGIYVTYGVFNGWDDLYAQASTFSDFAHKNSIGGLTGALNWCLMSLLSMSAIFLLPRQFHTTIVENRREKHLRTALWLVPLYLLLINIFVFPVAWGGNILFKGASVNAEMYSILIPQKFGQHIITVIVFLGGLSASVSMIIISSIALSIMMSNNLIIPYGILNKISESNVKDNTKLIVTVRKIGIALLIVCAYLFYKFYINENSLFSVGLMSFVIIAQLAPSFFSAIFWKRGSYWGAVSGLVAGVFMCYKMLILPEMSGARVSQSFFTIDYFDPMTNAFFWSLFVNTVIFALVSIFGKGNYTERNYAEMYVDIDKYLKYQDSAFVWKGTAETEDIRRILIRFLGEEKTKQALHIFNQKYNITDEEDTADARLIKFSENLLAGRIGTASAKILIESVTKEDKISLPEVLGILEESKQNILLNKQLTEQSQKLKQLSAQLQHANASLLEKDKQKDEFLDAVAHELRTPITAIRAAGELLQDDEDMPEGIRSQFLYNIISESDRLNELINDILYLDKLEHTEQVLEIAQYNIKNTIKKVIQPIEHLVEKEEIKLDVRLNLTREFFYYDEKRMIQVINNLLANAIKFTKDKHGEILLSVCNPQENLELKIYNSGKQIPDDELEMIFEKFYQSRNQNLKKPLGSGLGLSISKKIIEAHHGYIYAKNILDGVQFTLSVPQNYDKYEKNNYCR
ncbi:ATP-binding protein [Edaphocola aurantiacus]|uniref:ATP-binding protein n=1 Tax=Edaphocola aurantiacus TaxID=2601682 RepID=UPI001C93D45E|nr:ATP-binding protein [Edaphocola aurantiacus]